MRVIKRTTLAAFWEKHPQAEMPLRQWLAVAREAEWQSIADVRRTFAHADAVEVDSGNQVTVFKIGGNDFRLVVSLKYRWGMAYIRDFLTHAESDKDAWKKRH